MPRHPKCRKVCRLPTSCKFYTSENENIEAVNMTVEEYETIRLIDYMGLTQEECAEQMHVARTTVQRIYNDARKKLSTFLVEGTGLHILGGSYELCGNKTCNNCSKQCKSTDCSKNKEGLS